MKILRTQHVPAQALARLEEQVRAQSKRTRVETAILGTLALTGLAAFAVMAPNALRLLQNVVPDLRPTSQKQSIKRAIGRLIQQGLVHKQQGGYVLTKKGTDRLAAHTRFVTPQAVRGSRGKKWDGKWRVVAFDVKESRRHVRDELRGLLVSAGFVKLQDSVWVYPFQCDEVIALMKFHLRLGYDLIYMIVDAIEGDAWLRDHYSLPKQK